MDNPMALKVGQVIFVRSEGEYEVVRRISVDQRGMTEIETFNPRWGGKETHRLRDIRVLSRNEQGLSNRKRKP